MSTHYDVLGGTDHTLCGESGDTTGNPEATTCPDCRQGLAWAHMLNAQPVLFGGAA